MARVLECLTPTELPKKKSAMQRVENKFEKDTRGPKRAEKKNVPLKTVIRPMRSELGGANEFLDLNMRMEDTGVDLCPSQSH